MLGYGNFLVASGAPDQILQKIEYIPSPEEIYLRICEVVFLTAKLPCPLCEGEGTVFRRSQEQAGTPGESGEYRLASEDSQAA